MLFTHTTLSGNTKAVSLVIFVFILKLLNVVITQIRFRQWNLMHTLGNKLSGLFVFFLLPVYILFPATPFLPALIIILLVIVATIEESIILLISKTYDPNRKSIFSQPKIF